MTAAGQADVTDCFHYTALHYNINLTKIEYGFKVKVGSLCYLTTQNHIFTFHSFLVHRLYELI